MADKGKGKEVDKSPANPNLLNNNSSPDPSLLDRVTASANTLTRAALGFTAPLAVSEVRNSLPVGDMEGKSGGGGLGLASDSGPSAWDESSRVGQGQGQSDGGSREANRIGSSIRAGETQSHIRDSEDQFKRFLDECPSEDVAPSFVAAPSTGLQQSQLRESEYQQFLNAREPEAQFSSEKKGDGEKRTEKQEQEARDGHEVMALLSMPSHLPGTMQEDEEYGYMEDDGGDGVYTDWGLSEEQFRRLRGITDGLFLGIPEPTKMKDGQNFHLELWPQEEALGWVDRQGEGENENWKKAWEDVLNGYTDEVWGNKLAPLVRRAREEVNERDGSGEVRDPVALRRLRVVLGHLRGRGF